MFYNVFGEIGVMLNLTQPNPLLLLLTPPPPPPQLPLLLLLLLRLLVLHMFICCRLICGVARVGLIACGLLLRGDRQVELVVLCSVPPTCVLLSQVVDEFRQQVEVLHSFSFIS